LQKFADDLKFSYELNRVEDGAWGVLNVRDHYDLIKSLVLESNINVCNIEFFKEQYMEWTHCRPIES
jgi:hypothetical protein